MAEEDDNCELPEAFDSGLKSLLSSLLIGKTGLMVSLVETILDMGLDSGSMLKLRERLEETGGTAGSRGGSTLVGFMGSG